MAHGLNAEQVPGSAGSVQTQQRGVELAPEVQRQGGGEHERLLRAAAERSIALLRRGPQGGLRPACVAEALVYLCALGGPDEMLDA